MASPSPSPSPLHPHQLQQHPLAPHPHPHPQYQTPPPSMPPPPGAPPKAMDLEVTVVSGKHLKNVNWRCGDLRAYAVAYPDPSRRTATRPDDAGGCKPAWNERIVLQLPPHLSPHDPRSSSPSTCSTPSHPTRLPLVGSACSPLRDLLFLPALTLAPTPASPIITSRPAPPAAHRASSASASPFASAHLLLLSCSIRLLPPPPTISQPLRLPPIRHRHSTAQTSVKYKEEKAAERVAEKVAPAARDDYSEYHESTDGASRARML
ncbi:hypothetical protein ZWY2020_030905 [Hordeum vulgare]|nr:hypothetical protein ZWY2020_030905 [Hordeum vulgare]